MASGYLVVNADDFGYSQERNRGILHCFQKLAVSSVSLLVNAVETKGAVSIAAENKIPMGLHLNLTEGIPIGNNYKTIVGSNGFLLGKFGFRKAFENGCIDIKEVQQEIKEQIEAFKSLTGKQPTHVDGHHHIHIVPGVVEVFALALKRYGVGVARLPLELGLEKCKWVEADCLEFYRGVVCHAKMARSVLLQHGIKMTDGFLGLSTMGKNMTMERLQRQLIEMFSPPSYSENTVQQCNYQSDSFLAACEKGKQFDADPADTRHQFTHRSVHPRTCELMVHPGNVTGDAGGCGEGADQFSKSSDRQHESDILQEMRKDFYDQHSITLVSFKDVFSTSIVF